MRTLVNIPETDVAAPNDVRRRRRISRSAVIRQAVREYLLRHVQPNPDVGFGVWDADFGDSVDYQRLLRAGW